jgi:hypothetical protein
MHQGAWVYGMHGPHQVFPIRLNPKPKRTIAAASQFLLQQSISLVSSSLRKSRERHGGEGEGIGHGEKERWLAVPRLQGILLRHGR